LKIELPQIITQNNADLHPCWQKELANVVTDPKKLLLLLDIDADKYQQHFKARQLFPVRVPRPFIAKMRPGDINDPLLKQVMPLNNEFIPAEGFSTDPLQEHVTVATGLLHKYKHRVLLIVKAGCAVNCRYCFRRHFPYKDNSPNKARWQDALGYIAKHTEINEVIFSGGDPLMASDEHLAWLIEQVENISHIKRLRIHTRLPVVIPQRITPAFVKMLQNSRLKSSLVLHINHANEVDNLLSQAIMPLRKALIPLFNQSVLLKGINDSVNELVSLNEKVFDAGIQPYYLHLLDQVQGAAHFNMSLTEATTLYQALLKISPGFLVPKLVREIAGQANKTPINLP
jgi:EF-P beta-lysylation protein EpmB